MIHYSARISIQAPQRSQYTPELPRIQRLLFYFLYKINPAYYLRLQVPGLVRLLTDVDRAG